MKISRQEKTLQGLTLFEALLYLALFSIIFVVVIEIMSTIDQSNNTAKYRAEIDRNIIFVAEHIKESFRTSESINSTDTGMILLDLADAGYYQYTDSGSTLYFDNDGIETLPITTSKVAIGTFGVQDVENKDGDVVGVRVLFDISSARDPNIFKDTEMTFMVP
ncbi:hypothetical protein KC717_02065 [Candidatus Dojkabacteria bacterium]|uniref:Uncharacterized protein n=1 Tax=Candidatus Dojkabacteria bacterium TaxID=2099670 RepID=A0A955L7F8_9BACT|nr:hypothetical protein [Candidatus Dojkabacteria bacterium]